MKIINCLVVFLVIVFKVEAKTSLQELKYRNSHVVSWNFGSFITPGNHSVEFDLKFFSPQTPGQYSVVFFLTGFDGLVPAFVYIDFCNRLAVETKSIIVAFDRLKIPSLPDKEENLFEITLNWTIENLYSFFDNKNTPESIRGRVFPDIKTQGITFLGHSAAGHPLVSYLVKQCGLVSSLVLLDPVDGYDPFGIVKKFITNPPEQLNFAIPTLIASTGLASVVKAPNLTPCAPDRYSNKRFYECMSGPTWLLNFTRYGHIGVLDDWGRKLLSVCADCKENCDFPLYRRDLVKALGLFINGVKFKNLDFIKAIEDPTKSGYFNSSMPIDSVFKHNGYDVIQTGPFCARKK